MYDVLMMYIAQSKTSPPLPPYCMLCNTIASLERITVNVGDQAYPLKTISQMGMPNRNSIVINMAAYPEVSCGHSYISLSALYSLLFCDSR